MKQMQHVLYITEPDATLTANGKALEIRKEDGTVSHFPIHNLEAVVSFAEHPADEKAMQLCAVHAVNLTVCNRKWQLRYRITGKTRGNVLVRVKQYDDCRSEKMSETARLMIRAKIRNCAAVLTVFRKNHRDAEKELFCAAANQLKALGESAAAAQDEDQLRGIEGAAAAVYFSAYANMIRSEEEVLHFQGRNRRPPKDPVNALLSLTYTMLTSDAVTALESCGLDAAVGILHGLRPGKPSMALDLIEELRPVVADRFVLRLINLKILRPEDFETDEEGAVLLNRAGKQKFYREWNVYRKQDIYYPDQDTRIPVGLLPFAQSAAFASFLRGDTAEYHPFLLEECL